ncbi:hypothetical protein [Vibrio fortis]|uniref:hypothetical protein n=1 Tax=Vibrio fortis TaxID=212667 RepID=UPI0038CD513F
MRIRQIKAYRATSIISFLLGITALQELYICENLLIIGFSAGVLGTFLLGSAGLFTVFRFVSAFVKGTSLSLSSRVLGCIYSVLPVLLWYLCNVKFILVPAVNAKELSTFFIPSALAVLNGVIGVILFFGVVKINNKLLGKVSS